MKRKFKVIVERKGAEFVARCEEVAGAVARGRDLNDAVEKIKAVIIKKLGEGGSDAGSAPVPQPVRPPPNGPIIEVHK